MRCSLGCDGVGMNDRESCQGFCYSATYTPPTLFCDNQVRTFNHPPTHLPIDHVTHGHSYLHPGSLDVVEVEVMEHRQTNGAKRHGSCIAESHVKSPLIVWVVVFKVQN